MSDQRTFGSFKEFYPFYLSQHSNIICRRLHITGTTLASCIFIVSLATLNAWLLIAVPLIGYPFSWVGHFFFESNKPAAFKHPVWSFMGDFLMIWHTVTGKIPA